MKDKTQPDLLAETWAASVEPFLDTNPIVRAYCNLVTRKIGPGPLDYKARMLIAEAFPQLIRSLVENADRLEEHAKRLTELVPVAPGGFKP